MEMPLATNEDVTLVRSRLSDLRIATCVTATITGATLVMSGMQERLDRAQLLVSTLLATGEWVALAENFVLETKEKKKDEGPVEQILVKIPETISALISKYLKPMERAASAVDLK